MILDILQIIGNYSSSITNINMSNIDTETSINMKVHKLTCKKQNEYLTEKILGQSKYSDLKILDLENNTEVKNVNRFASTLKKLTCGWGLTQQGIMYLKITDLDIRSNWNILSLNHLEKTLQTLHLRNSKIENNGICDLKIKELEICTTGGWSEITDINNLANTLKKLTTNSFRLRSSGIKDLKLEELHIKNNEKIHDINFLKNTLRVLDCSGSFSKLGQNGISQLAKLEYLNVSGNMYIYDVNHLANTLKYLYCNHSGVRQDGIEKLTKLQVLHSNNGIYDVNHISSSLTDLNCCGYIHKGCRVHIDEIITQEGLSKCVNLKHLYMSRNFYIKNINHLKNLETLYCSHTNLTQGGISELKNLETLVMNECEKITDINHMIHLTKLHCKNSCMTQGGISELTTIKKLNVSGNKFVTDVNHFANSLVKLKCEYSGISQKGIHGLKKIRYLDCSNNTNITDVNHLCKSLLKIVCAHTSAVTKNGISKLGKHVKICNIYNKNF